MLLQICYYNNQYVKGMRKSLTEDIEAVYELLKEGTFLRKLNI